MPAPSFSDFVDSHAPVEKELPFVHSTRCEFLLPLCTAGALLPQVCPVFRESLLYFFYGRPAYRSHVGDLPNTLMAPMPICLVFKPGLVDVKLKRVFPFDTGAANGGMFSPHIDPTQLAAFSMNPTLLAIRKAVRAFFESNAEYYSATAKSGLTPTTDAAPAVASYCSLITAEGESPYDDRRAAIEAQVEESLILKDNLLAVILPTPFLDNPSVRDAVVNQWRAYPLRYSHVRGTVPNQYVRLIAEKLEQFLREGGYL